MKTKKANGTSGFVVFIFLVVIIALGYYTYLSSNSPDHLEVTETSEKDILLNYDMDAEYPKTVRETVKLHCRYLKYVYSDEFMKNATEDEIFTMNQQIRKLFDEELLVEFKVESKTAVELTDSTIYTYKHLLLFSFYLFLVLNYTILLTSKKVKISTTDFHFFFISISFLFRPERHLLTYPYHHILT